MQINADRVTSKSISSASPTGTAGTGQSSATTLGVTTDANMLSLAGRFAAAYPLYDGTNRMLVSWSPCLVGRYHGDAGVDQCLHHDQHQRHHRATRRLRSTRYGSTTFDAGTLGLVLSADAGTMITEPVIMQARDTRPHQHPGFHPHDHRGAGTWWPTGMGLS